MKFGFDKDNFRYESQCGMFWIERFTNLGRGELKSCEPVFIAHFSSHGFSGKVFEETITLSEAEDLCKTHLMQISAEIELIQLH